MFRGWGFLLGEIWMLLLVAALLGLFVGWLIWGGRKTADCSACEAEAARLRSELDSTRAKLRACEDKATAPAPVAAVAPMPEPVAEPAPEPAAPTAPEVASAADVGSKPATLTAPRDGAPDDLKRIKGIGPKLEALCNRLGFWHFDQIANWTSDEIAWVDANLEAFKGRVTRDDWVAQAKVLAAEKNG
ncbi:MAG: hypothetical protein R3D60_14780 [Paracoccaceae bacterium]